MVMAPRRSSPCLPLYGLIPSSPKTRVSRDSCFCRMSLRISAAVNGLVTLAIRMRASGGVGCRLFGSRQP